MDTERAREMLVRLQELAAEIASAIYPDVQGAVTEGGADQRAEASMARKKCGSGFYCGKYGCTPPFSCSDFGCTSNFTLKLTSAALSQQ